MWSMDQNIAKERKVKSFGYAWLFAIPWTVACQPPPSMGFSRQEYGSGLPFPSPGDLLNPGIKPLTRMSPEFVVFQLFSRVWLFATSWTAVPQAFLSFTTSWSLLKFMSIESVMPSNHLILWCPLSSCLHSFPASGSFPMSWLSTSGGQSTGASVSASVLPMNIQG